MGFKFEKKKKKKKKKFPCGPARNIPHERWGEVKWGELAGGRGVQYFLLKEIQCGGHMSQLFQAQIIPKNQIPSF